MSAAPVDYPPAVLEEAEDASRHAFDEALRDGSVLGAAQQDAAEAYAAVLARYTVSHRLTRSPGGVLVLDTPGEPIPAAALSDTEPPVDEDAAALGEAYERGRADAIRDAAGYLRLRGWCVDAAQLEEHEREHRAGPVCAKCESAKQGAASS